MKKIKAFTLSEATIVLVVLGVIAAITIPSLIMHQKGIADRTKLKKAWEIYDGAIQTMRTEHPMMTKDSFIAWANQANCPNTVSYFKTTEVDANNGCVFKTADGVWFNITDILHPVITLDAKNNQTEKNTFKFVVSYDSDNLTFSVNDYTFNGLTAEEKTDLKKLFSFINDEEVDIEDENEDKLSTVDAMEQYWDGDMTFTEMMNQLYPDKKACVGTDTTNCIQYNSDCYHYSIISKIFDCPVYAAGSNGGCDAYVYENNKIIAKYHQPEYFLDNKMALYYYQEVKDDGTVVEHNCEFDKNDDCYKYAY